MRTTIKYILVLAVVLALGGPSSLAKQPCDQRWVPLFNGKDLSGWKMPPKGEGHWKVVDGAIDYDARSGGDLWTEKSYGDFVLKIEWRLKPTKEIYGSDREQDGKPYAYFPDSGLYLRGIKKAQTNMWPKAVGSGEVWGYRADKNLPKEIRDACTPKLRADKPIGQWNKQIVTMKGDRLTVVLNGKTVIDNARLPDVPSTGPIGLQHHGGFDEKTGRWRPASACVAFRNIHIKEL